jgi:hypothetical protein
MSVTNKGGQSLAYVATYNGSGGTHTVKLGATTVTAVSKDPLTDACAHARSQGYDGTTFINVTMPLVGGGTRTHSAHISRGYTPFKG